MAVYTKINQNDVNFISKQFRIKKIITFKGIKNGIENTNYLLKTKKGKYILTIFEKRVQTKDLPFFMKLMDKLHKKKINCPKPLKNIDEKYIFTLKNKSACIVTFVNGKDKTKLNVKNCYEIGKNIGKLHLVSKKIRLYRKNSMSLSSWPKILNKIGNKSKTINSNLKNIMKTNLKDIKKKMAKKSS